VTPSLHQVSVANDAWQWINVMTIIYAVAICTTKLAILCLYRRTITGRKPILLDWAILALMPVLIIFYVVTLSMKIAACIPRAKISDPSVPGTCLDIQKVISASGLFGMITDYIILFLPLPTLLKLHISSKKRKGLIFFAFIFGLL
jgi:hypothetical protein